eukprot:3474767-Amphidinium_carterae.1
MAFKLIQDSIKRNGSMLQLSVWEKHFLLANVCKTIELLGGGCCGRGKTIARGGDSGRECSGG